MGIPTKGRSTVYQHPKQPPIYPKFSSKNGTGRLHHNHVSDIAGTEPTDGMTPPNDSHDTGILRIMPLDDVGDIAAMIRAHPMLTAIMPGNDPKRGSGACADKAPYANSEVKTLCKITRRRR